MKSADFIETQRSRYLENEISLFLQIKILITHQGILYGKSSFVVEVTFKEEEVLETLCCRVICMTSREQQAYTNVVKNINALSEDEGQSARKFWILIV